MATVSVRYIVYDVDAAIDFYCRNLGFTEVMHPAPTFAMLARGDLRLVLSAAGGGPGGGQAMPDGRLPEPGGWNRFSIEVPDLAAKVEELRRQGAHFRNEIVTGVGGKQILLEDPSGNPVELFEPIVPVLRHTPPTKSLRSTIATCRPSVAAAIAAFRPPGPEPITKMSKSYPYTSVTTGRSVLNPGAARSWVNA